MVTTPANTAPICTVPMWVKGPFSCLAEVAVSEREVNGLPQSYYCNDR